MKSVLWSVVVSSLIHSLTSAQVSSGSDGSMTFDEFVRRVDIAFTDELFKDLRKKLPTDFAIWGYDVGDFSGDGKYDIAMCVRPKHYAEKKLQVHFFLNQGDSVLDLKTMDVSYHSIPLEVGFTIENGVCFMTTKLGEYNWLIRGYTYYNGSFILVDRYEATRLFPSVAKRRQVGYESYINYRNLLSNENFFNAVNNSGYAKLDYYAYPAYRKGRAIFEDYATAVVDTTDKFILAGREHWKGASDVSFTSRAYYDSSAICFSMEVIDDSVVTADVNPDGNDYVQLWFDCGAGHKVEVPEDSGVTFRDKPDSTLYSLTISLGNFSTEKPKVKLISKSGLSDLQLRELSEMEVTVERLANGYTVDIRIPVRVFGITSLARPLGFTAVVHDADSALDPGDVTIMATSKLEPWNPLSLGVLRFVPDGEYFGEVTNLVLPLLLARIAAVGL